MEESAKYIGNELELFSNAVNWKAYFSRHFARYINGDVLEAGAGIGETTAHLMRGLDTIRSWTCLEPDQGLAEEIFRKKTSGLLPDTCKVIIATTEELTPAPSFDSILYIDVIEHIKDDKSELERAAALLKPNGYLNILVPAHQFLFSPFDAAIGHYRRYDKKRLKEAVPATMKNIQLKYLDTAGVMTSLANKILLRKSHPTIGQVKFWDNLIIPVSRLADPLFGFKVGKTLIGTWQKT